MGSSSVISVCTDPNILKLLKGITIILDICFIVVPLVAIIYISVDLFKKVINPGEKAGSEIVQKAACRIITGLIIIILPSFFSGLWEYLGIYNDDSSIAACFVNIDNIEYYENLSKLNAEKEAATYKKNLSSEVAAANEKEAIIKARQKKLYEANKENNAVSGENQIVGTHLGQKYQLSDNQLKGLAIICQREQGTAIGAAAEASLIANRFELFGSKYGTDGNGLYNYVADCGWWGNARAKMQSNYAVRPEVLAAVKEVFVLGNRTLPLYIDEHDCIDCGQYGFDINKIVTNGKTITNHADLKNHNNYRSNQTTIYNRYGSTYTFYTFPTSSSDPFGYTASAKNKYDSLNRGA